MFRCMTRFHNAIADKSAPAGGSLRSTPATLVLCTIVAVCLILASYATAADPHYQAGQYKSGQLRIIDGLPVVSVSGTPEEMGEQIGTLLKQPLATLLHKKDEVAHGFGLPAAPDGFAKLARPFTFGFPAPYRHELEAIAKAADVDVDLLDSANIMYELSRFPACSTLSVEPARSATGQPIFGRNFDFPTFGFLDQYSLITAYHPQGKHAFISIAFPGIVGVFSGINDAGLCVAQLEVNSAADKSTKIVPWGTPVPMCFRRVLEECTTIDAAEKMIGEQNRMMLCNLAVCDREHAAVFEITTKSVVRRAPESGVCPCTNHFRTPGLATDTQCWRYDKLCQCRTMDKLAVSDVAKLLDAANQHPFTMQTMIFEPVSMTGHISFGPMPSSSQPLKEIDLAELLKPAK
jgi:hypothetical protein